jgi:hypothetical protein
LLPARASPEVTETRWKSNSPSPRGASKAVCHQFKIALMGFNVSQFSVTHSGRRRQGRLQSVAVFTDRLLRPPLQIVQRAGHPVTTLSKDEGVNHRESVSLSMQGAVVMPVLLAIGIINVTMGERASQILGRRQGPSALGWVIYIVTFGVGIWLDQWLKSRLREYGYGVLRLCRQPCAAANPALALWLQSWRPVGRVAELGSFAE